MYNYTRLLAHYGSEHNKEKQYLICHLFKVAMISKKTGRAVGLEKTAELLGLLHDLGKSNVKFQQYIKGDFVGRVNHSSAGAKALDYIEVKVVEKYDIPTLLRDCKAKKRSWEVYKEIIQYPILAHHGLYDIINQQSDYHSEARLNYDHDSKYDFMNQDFQFLKFLNQEYYNTEKRTIYQLYYEGFLEFLKIETKLKDLARTLEDKKYWPKALHFYYGALVRLLLSILKDADIYDSSNHYRQEKDKRFSSDDLLEVWDKMYRSVEELYGNFATNPNPSELDKVRTSLSNEIYKFAKENNAGIYKLNMPVGSGKTYAALRYSVNNAKTFEKSRIFYCTAFLSVLEQNASEIKRVIGEEYVLEHHSNIMEDLEQNGDLQDENEYLVNEYLKESWESPVILTTLVQLFNTMFKEKSSNIRRFSKLINGVIIIDEIQSLPTKVVYNGNLMMNFLTHIMNCSIIHCTATQPNLDSKKALTYPCIYGGNENKKTMVDSSFPSKIFDRVRYHNLLGRDFNTKLGTGEIIDHVITQLKTEESILIVLNTKAAVATLYNELIESSRIQDLEVQVVYLTTNQCPRHRLDIIKRVKRTTTNLRNCKKENKIICVSTKLVESGVDIDFDVVYRSLAGIDSIIQCAGRCNREGKKQSKGNLFILEYNRERLSSLVELRAQQVAARTALRKLAKGPLDHSNLNLEKASDYYFDKLFLNSKEENNVLEYPLGSTDTIFKLLSTNPDRVSNYKIKHQVPLHFKLTHGFKTAAMNFDLIKESTINVITQYNNSELIEKLYGAIESYDYQETKSLLKRLQQYTIGIRRIDQYEKYISKALDGDVLILNQEAYDDEVGLIQGELQSLVF